MSAHGAALACTTAAIQSEHYALAQKQRRMGSRNSKLGIEVTKAETGFETGSLFSGSRGYIT